MIERRPPLPDSYEFIAKPDPVEVNAVYSFETTTGHKYSITFIEAVKITNLLDDLPVISNAIYVIVDNTLQNGKAGLDARIGITIVHIVKHYLHADDINSILAFNCDAEDGKQVKRHNKFDRWYRTYAADMGFEKIDEEILAPVGQVYVPTFISILYRTDHPRRERIPAEMEKLRNQMETGK